MVFISLAAFVFIPPNIVSGYQKMVATGIYAISYERNESTCHFEMIDKKTLSGTCNLPFENYSEHDVKFNIEFYDKYLFEDEVPMMTLLNHNGPYEVLLQIEAEIDVLQMEGFHS